MPSAHPALVKEQAVSLFLQGLTPTQISKKIGIGTSAIKNWVTQYKAPELKNLVGKAIEVQTNRWSSKQSDGVRTALGEAIANQVQMLAKQPAMCVEDLRNTPDRQGLAAVAKTVAETANLVFGWDKQESSGLIVLADARAFDAEKPAIDVQSSPLVVDQPVQHEAIQTESKDITPQSPQVSDSQHQ